jgi:hypothetical protein
VYKGAVLDEVPAWALLLRMSAIEDVKLDLLTEHNNVC